MNSANENASETAMLINVLSGMPIVEAIKTLNQATLFLIENAHGVDAVGRVYPLETPLLRSRRRLSKIDADEEVRAFLHSLPCAYTIDELEAACRSKFGYERAPSSSAIHRYIQRLKAPRIGGGL
ncbi:hypothetical protein [Zhongshania sp.]|uniref:hypothetical protein n=1 Tax=Zhongshania sp. TaxID=1971902 RepID=UPI001B604736|nr:hypothetical protein [Zhongshania sp.]MBQ0796245.1 hypothetical protein [Zhongshania sp.]